MPSDNDKRSKESTNGKSLSPLITLIAGGIGTALLAVANNFFQWYSSHNLEQDKLRSTLILKAIEAPTADERKKALVFLVQAGLISDQGGKIMNLKIEDVPRVETSGASSVARTGTFPLEGKIETFGGPQDLGLAPDEDVSLISRNEITSPEFREYFLPAQPTGTTGSGRRLNPEKYYISCRWDYSVMPKDFLRRIVVKVTNPRNGKSALAKPVDWGPNPFTGRVASISPGLANFLGVNTDDSVEISLAANPPK